MTQPILTVDNLSVDIPTPSGMLRAVQNVSFQVNQAETLCIVGESGSGKSLTALAIMDLLPKKAIRRANTIELDRTTILNIGERRMSDLRGNRMAMIFQEPMTSLNPVYTIGNQLEEALLRHRRVSRIEARNRAVWLLEKVGITAAASRLRQYPHQLSGGLRQRIMIAMSLMCEPRLIIADEPTTALDVTIQAQILHLLLELQREFRMGLILITHDLGVVARIARHVAVMYAGQIVETGTVEQIFSSPAHPYTQKLISCIPIPGKTKRGEPLGSIPGMVPSLIGHMQGCHFAGRCGYAHNACLAGPVAMRPGLTGGHLYRCVLPLDQSARNFNIMGVA